MSAAPCRENGRTAPTSSLVAPEFIRLFCKWQGCKADKGFCDVEELSQHVEEVHCYKNGLKTPPQMSHVCLWEGCRFYNLPNSSLAWLTRHVRIHTKNRPLKCLMNGCSSSFWTVTSLNKHLQLHFSESPNQSKGSVKKEDAKQHGPRLKMKRKSQGHKDSTTPVKRWTQPLIPPFGPLSYANPFDDRSRQVLGSVVQRMTLNMVESGSSSPCVKLMGKVVGWRRSKDFEELLVEWSPPLVLQEWVAKDQLQLTKYVAVNKLDPHIRYLITSFSPLPSRRRVDRRKWKPTISKPSPYGAPTTAESQTTPTHTLSLMESLTTPINTPSMKEPLTQPTESLTPPTESLTPPTESLTPPTESLTLPLNATPNRPLVKTEGQSRVSTSTQHLEQAGSLTPASTMAVAPPGQCVAGALNKSSSPALTKTPPTSSNKTSTPPNKTPLTSSNKTAQSSSNKTPLTSSNKTAQTSSNKTRTSHSNKTPVPPNVDTPEFVQSSLPSSYVSVNTPHLSAVNTSTTQETQVTLPETSRTTPTQVRMTPPTCRELTRPANSLDYIPLA